MRRGRRVRSHHAVERDARALEPDGCIHRRAVRSLESGGSSREHTSASRGGHDVWTARADDLDPEHGLQRIQGAPHRRLDEQRNDKAGLSPNSDYDVYVYAPDNTGSQVTRAASSSNPESTSWDVSNGKYTIYVVPYDTAPSVAFSGTVAGTIMFGRFSEAIPNAIPAGNQRFRASRQSAGDVRNTSSDDCRISAS